MIIHVYLIHPMSDGGRLHCDDPQMQANFVSVSEHLRLLVGTLKNKNVDMRSVRFLVPQLEWYPLFGLVDWEVGMEWCLEQLETAEIVYRAVRNLSSVDKEALPLTVGVQRELRYCDEEVWDGDEMVRRLQVFTDAGNLAQWVSDQENGVYQEV